MTRPAQTRPSPASALANAVLGESEGIPSLAVLCAARPHLGGAKRRSPQAPHQERRNTSQTRPWPSLALGDAILGARGTIRRVLLLVAVAAAACSSQKQSWRETEPPEVFVEVLPRSAQLSVDGRALGPGARSLAVPDPTHVYVFRVSAPGFAPAERSGTGAAFAGARLGIVLRPEGFGSGRRLELDEAGGLAHAAALLERRGEHRLAVEYAERAVELAPEVAMQRKVLGTAFLALGNERRAIQEYSTYLQLAPDAPDRRQVERTVARLRGDVTIPLGR
jgi:tetratricopeptide (TPR) repeat protein